MELTNAECDGFSSRPAISSIHLGKFPTASPWQVHGKSAAVLVEDLGRGWVSALREKRERRRLVKACSVRGRKDEENQGKDGREERG